jgi:hypothetical protein
LKTTIEGLEVADNSRRIGPRWAALASLIVSVFLLVLAGGMDSAEHRTRMVLRGASNIFFILSQLRLLRSRSLFWRGFFYFALLLDVALAIYWVSIS